MFCSLHIDFDSVLDTFPKKNPDTDQNTDLDTGLNML